MPQMPRTNAAIIIIELTIAATFACLVVNVNMQLSPFLSTLFEINAGTFNTNLPYLETMALVNASSLVRSPNASFKLSNSSCERLTRLLPFTMGLLKIRDSLRP